MELLRKHLGEVRLADAGRAGEAEYRERLVAPARRDAAAQLRGDRVDRGILSDDARLHAAREIDRVDGDELLASWTILRRGAVGQAIEHDPG